MGGEGRRGTRLVMGGEGRRGTRVSDGRGRRGTRVSDGRGREGRRGTRVTRLFVLLTYAMYYILDV